MIRRLAYRLAHLVPTLLGVTLLTFLLLHLSPGDPASLLDDGRSGVSGEVREAWRRLRGLDAPLWIQYGRWLTSSLSFDFGLSFTDERPVADLIAEALPRTLALTVPALFITYAVAIPVGVWLAVREGSRIERWVSLGLLGAYSVPTFWAALMLLLFFASGEWWVIFPLRGLVEDGTDPGIVQLLWHLTLPVLCLSYPPICRAARLQRAALREVLGQDYVLAAKARGLSPRRVLWRHAVPNALLPMAASVSVDLPWLIGGSVIIERIFTIRGMGLLSFEAILQRNYPVIMGVTTATAIATLLSMLMSDALVAWLDPRGARTERDLGRS